MRVDRLREADDRFSAGCCKKSLLSLIWGILHVLTAAHFRGLLGLTDGRGDDLVYLSPGQIGFPAGLEPPQGRARRPNGLGEFLEPVAGQTQEKLSLRKVCRSCQHRSAPASRLSNWLHPQPHNQPAPPPDLSANPAFAQSRIKPQSFYRSLSGRVGLAASRRQGLLVVRTGAGTCGMFPVSRSSGDSRTRKDHQPF